MCTKQTWEAAKTGSNPAVCWLVTTARGKMQHNTWVPSSAPGRAAKRALALAVLSAAHRLLI